MAQGRADEAARLREELILQYPQGTYRTRALEDHLQVLSEAGNAEALVALAGRVHALDAAATRDLESRVVEVLAPKDPGAALERGLRLLKANAADDPADRAARALDRPALVDRLGPEDTMLLGETLRSHRHFDRAVALLERARPRLPGKQDDLLFSIGRAYFASERYPEAEKAYLEGASATRDGEMRASFLYQAGRCAQLLGDDERAERYLGQAIAAGGKTTRGSASLTQRARLRARQGRFAEAAADVRAVRARFPRSHAVVEASLGYSIALIGADRRAAALRELELIKPRLLEKRDVPEVQYWKARSLEKRSPAEAVRLYLKVLKADTPTHFAYFARQRLAGPLAAHATAEEKRLAALVEERLARGDTAAARQAQTDAALLAPPAREREELDRLADLYRQTPEYREVLELPPPEYPRFPIFGEDPAAEPGRLEVLLASGLFDDAVDLVLQRYPLHPLPSGVARSEALRRGGASRASIYAIEVVAREDIPDDYVPAAAAQAGEGAGLPPVLPRRRGAAVGAVRRGPAAGAVDHAGGVPLQPPREVRGGRPRAAAVHHHHRPGGRPGGGAGGRDRGGPVRAAAWSSSSGRSTSRTCWGSSSGTRTRPPPPTTRDPHQARLWARMSPAEGNDFYLSPINFDETKDYVRKVLNSYERYGEIYESRPARGRRPRRAVATRARLRYCAVPCRRFLESGVSSERNIPTMFRSLVARTGLMR